MIDRLHPPKVLRNMVRAGAVAGSLLLLASCSCEAERPTFKTSSETSSTSGTSTTTTIEAQSLDEKDQKEKALEDRKHRANLAIQNSLIYGNSLTALEGECFISLIKNKDDGRNQILLILNPLSIEDPVDFPEEGERRIIAGVVPYAQPDERGTLVFDTVMFEETNGQFGHSGNWANIVGQNTDGSTDVVLSRSADSDKLYFPDNDFVDGNKLGGVVSLNPIANSPNNPYPIGQVMVFEEYQIPSLSEICQIDALPSEYVSPL